MIDHGELALGKNVLVAFMPWGDTTSRMPFFSSEKLVREDAFTSIHIEEFEVEARDTKLGKEEITRDIPNVGRRGAAGSRRERDYPDWSRGQARGYSRGQGYAEGRTQLTPEEKLLRAIFGEKASTSRIPP